MKNKVQNIVQHCNALSQKISCAPDRKEFAFCMEIIIFVYSFQIHHVKKLQIKDESIESEYLSILRLSIFRSRWPRTYEKII